MVKKKERDHFSTSQEWYTLKILGKEVPRLRVSNEDLDSVTRKCRTCKAGLNQLHLLGCLDEQVPCPKHGLVFIDRCDCEAYEEGL